MTKYKLRRYGVVEGTPTYMEETFDTKDKAERKLIGVANELKEYYGIPLNEIEYESEDSELQLNHYKDEIFEGNYTDNTRMNYVIVEVE